MKQETQTPVDLCRVYRFYQSIWFSRLGAIISETLWFGNKYAYIWQREVLYSNRWAKTDNIDVTCWLKQGCILSTLLFNLYVDDLVLRISSLDIRIKRDGKKVAVMLYADDLVLREEILLNEINEWCKHNYINNNQQKSNIVHFRPTSVMQTRFRFNCGTICIL